MISIMNEVETAAQPSKFTGAKTIYFDYIESLFNVRPSILIWYKQEALYKLQPNFVWDIMYYYIIIIHY